jgi:glucose/arabinose dehydrogenase
MSPTKPRWHYSFTQTIFLCSILALSELTLAKQNNNSEFVSEGQTLSVEFLTKQQDVIWGFDFLSEQKILFTERSGKLKVLDLPTKEVTLVKGVPTVWSHGQGGLLDVRVLPPKRTQVFLTYSEPLSTDKATTSLATALFDKNKLHNVRTLLSSTAIGDEEIHFGSRIEFDDSGHVYFTIGDRNDRPKVQNLAFHNGKVLRLMQDGSVPKDNPFVKTNNAKPEIWSYGHRSPQGLARDPITNALWLAEMGPRGGDELNLILPGSNYGWPEVTYGREYWGPRIGVTEKPGTQQPVAHWVPSISPSGIAVYRGSKMPRWQGNIFLGCLSGTHLHRLVLVDNKVLKEESLLSNMNLRIRNVRAGLDGNLYFSTDDGQIGRIVSH